MFWEQVFCFMFSYIIRINIEYNYYYAVCIGDIIPSTYQLLIGRYIICVVSSLFIYLRVLSVNNNQPQKKLFYFCIPFTFKINGSKIRSVMELKKLKIQTVHHSHIFLVMCQCAIKDIHRLDFKWQKR